VLGRDGIKVAGEHFEIHSTCEPDFLKECAFYVEEIVAGYQRHFKVRRNAGRRIPMFLLADRAEYIEWQRQKFGSAVENPAFYDPGENTIVAYNTVEKAKAAAIRVELARVQKAMEDVKRAAAQMEAKLDKVVRELRSEAKTAEQVRALREQERTLRRELDEYRTGADAEIEKCRRIVEHNNRALREQTRGMYQTLFHEGFHAFSRNYLFAEKAVPHWLDEGMACVFEQSVVEAGELIHGQVDAELQRTCRAGFAARRAIPLGDLLKADGRMFAVTHLGSAARSHMAYAQSWAMAHWLTQQATLEQLDRYVSDVSSGRDPVLALVEMLGRPVRTIEEQVRRHVGAEAGAEPGKPVAWRRASTVPLARVGVSVEHGFTLVYPAEFGDGYVIRGGVRLGADGSKLECWTCASGARMVDDVDTVMKAIGSAHPGAKFTPGEAFAADGRETALLIATWIARREEWSARVLVVRGPEATHALAFASEADAFEKRWPGAEAVMRSLRFLKPAGAADARRQVDALLEEGHQRLTAADGVGALGLFVRAAALSPNTAPVEHSVALARAAMQQWGEALAAAQRAVDLDAANPAYLLTLADVQRRATKLDAAGATYRRVTEVDPRCESAYIEAAALLWPKSQGDVQALLRRGAENVPESAAIAIQWARVAELRKEVAEARRAYERVLEIEPENGEARQALARLPRK